VSGFVDECHLDASSFQDGGGDNSQRQDHAKWYTQVRGFV
jgi:hypothetical protein